MGYSDFRGCLFTPHDLITDYASEQVLLRTWSLLGIEPDSNEFKRYQVALANRDKILTTFQGFDIFDELKQQGCSKSLAVSTIATNWEQYPLRLDHCDVSGYRCCGTCTKRCFHRCVSDLSYRLWELALVYVNTPEQYRSNLPGIHKYLVEYLTGRCGKVTYYGALKVYNNEVLGYYRNRGIQQRTLMNDYSNRPLTYIDDSNPSRPPIERFVIDERTGQIQVLEWPKSGLCPMCTPARERVVRKGSNWVSKSY